MTHLLAGGCLQLAAALTRRQHYRTELAKSCHTSCRASRTPEHPAARGGRGRPAACRKELLGELPPELSGAGRGGQGQLLRPYARHELLIESPQEPPAADAARRAPVQRRRKELLREPPPELPAADAATASKRRSELPLPDLPPGAAGG